MGVRSPFDADLFGFVDVVYFAMKGRVIAGYQLYHAADKGEVLARKCVTPCPKQVQGLPVHKEDGLLGFVYNELRP